MWLRLTSLLCRDIRSSSWLTRKDGGSAATPPRGIIISSRHMGHLKEPVSRDGDAAILVRQCRQTVWEHCRSFGVCSPPSYIPETEVDTLVSLLWAILIYCIAYFCIFLKYIFDFCAFSTVDYHKVKYLFVVINLITKWSTFTDL